jgi:hypothetical protein
MHHDGVAIADELQQSFELGAAEIVAGDVIGERAADVDAVELPVGALLQGADPGVADSLTVDVCS